MIVKVLKDTLRYIHYNNRQMKWKQKAQVNVSEKAGLLSFLYLHFVLDSCLIGALILQTLKCFICTYLDGLMTRKLWINKEQ